MSVMRIGRWSTDSRLILRAIQLLLRVSRRQKIITDQFYLFSIGRLSLGLEKRFGVDLPSVDYRPIIGRLTLRQLLFF